MFDYLIDKIRKAVFLESPFRHLEVNDFFSEEHLAAITAAREVDIANASSDEELFERMFAASYKIIDFPGCVIDRRDYIRWHKNKSRSTRINTSCEGFGVTLRLFSPSTPIVADIMAFINGPEFQDALIEKFDIDRTSVFYDCGIQKYLDGYEISPHPDIRRKALTYMVNINPSADAETSDHHTHYLRLRPERDYVRSFWSGNARQDRCWLPWDWCETVKEQRRNNSIIIFSPGNDTLHGVKADYDHLRYQRTQLYGNFWHHKSPVDACPAWEDLDIKAVPRVTGPAWKRAAKKVLPAGVLWRVEHHLRGRNVVGWRLGK